VLCLCVFSLYRGTVGAYHESADIGLAEEEIMRWWENCSYLLRLYIYCSYVMRVMIFYYKREIIFLEHYFRTLI
jgi:hypothetical protein